MHIVDELPFNSPLDTEKALTALQCHMQDILHDLDRLLCSSPDFFRSELTGARQRPWPV